MDLHFGLLGLRNGLPTLLYRQYGGKSKEKNRARKMRQLRQWYPVRHLDLSFADRFVHAGLHYRYRHEDDSGVDVSSGSLLLLGRTGADYEEQPREQRTVRQQVTAFCADHLVWVYRHHRLLLCNLKSSIPQRMF